MEGDNRQTYQGLKHASLNESNVYDLCQVSSGNQERRAEEPKDIKESNNKELTTWNKPIIIIIIVLLSLIVILLIAIFCLMLIQLFVRDTTSTAGSGATTEAGTGASTGSNGSPGVDDILLIAQKLYNDSTALPTSCKQLKIQHQTIQSGYYIFASANGSTDYTAYCNMYELCGSTGPWTRIAYLGWNPQNCPSGFRPYQSGGVRACGRPVTNSGSCVSVQFPSNGISYSQICGRVYGYQYGSTDAIYQSTNSYRNDLNSHYVDGVSITRGSPRQHVWTLMAGESEASNSSSACPCNNGSTVSVQSFIGDNYYCESGNADNSTSSTLYTSDRLWDQSSYSCRSLESPCCTSFGSPWFHRDYGSTTTTDYIELRVCGDEGTDDEDVPVSFYEIYVK